jgi:tRNA G18 (ribose-2'-O)-methylase SpoU
VSLDATNDNRNLVNKYKGKSVHDIKNDMANRAFQIHVAIENYQHDFNIGSIVRNANAFNVAGVHIIGKRHWNRRGAMSTEKYLSLFHHENVDVFVNWTASAGLRIVGVDNTPGSTELSKSDLPLKAVYVFGQEGPGLSEQVRQRAEYVVAIEQFGSTRSVNVGVASGILLYEWARRHLLH